jgi:glycine/serine hydroxymethyltransferase
LLKNLLKMDAYNIESTKTENEQLLIDSELKLGGRMSKEMAADLHLQLEKNARRMGRP